MNEEEGQLHSQRY